MLLLRLGYVKHFCFKYDWILWHNVNLNIYIGNTRLALKGFSFRNFRHDQCCSFGNFFSVWFYLFWSWIFIYLFLVWVLIENFEIKVLFLKMTVKLFKGIFFVFKSVLTLNIPAYLPPYSYRQWTNLTTNCIWTMSALTKKMLSKHSFY